MKTFKHATLLTLLLATGGAWAQHHMVGHENHTAMQASMQKEQKDWGIAGEAKAATRTITLTMSDKMRFTPSQIDLKQGETVRLRVKNRGKVMHELVLGTPQELAAHAEMMKKYPGMEHDEPYMTHVAPGKTGEIVWTFNRAGEFEFACLIAGHYQSGMKGTIRVAAQPQEAPSAAAMPYAGQQQREIKALSAQEMKAYTEGMGHGFAKAAELNGYPGPMHVLELAKALELSEAQRTQSQTLLQTHKAEARRLGAELIEAERALDQAFANRSIDAESLTRLTRAAAEKFAALRAEHLKTHLAQTALLTPQQIERYKTLRGYGSDKGMAMDHQSMTHEGMKHQEMNHEHSNH